LVFRLFGFTILLPGILLAMIAARALWQQWDDGDQQVRAALERLANVGLRTAEQELRDWQHLNALVRIERAPIPRITPADSLAYSLGPAREPLQAAELAAAESEELRFQRYPRALEMYRQLSRSAARHVRASALVRLARVARKLQRTEEALEAYRQLASYGNTPVGGVPADLLARFELCSAGKEACGRLYGDLVAGRWTLDKTLYLFYSEAIRSKAPPDIAARLQERERQKIALTHAVEEWFERPRRELPGGYIALSGDTSAVVLSEHELRNHLARKATVEPSMPTSIQSSDALAPSLSAIRSLAGLGLPWTLVVAPAEPERLRTQANRTRTLLAGVLVVLLLLLASGAYLTTRSVRREMEIASMKHDFVSAVSHEFRSPLTGIRQLAEMLSRNRVPSDERRQEYYRRILEESDRLSRLVENVLDFSRMESGRKEFRFEPTNAAEVLADVADFVRNHRLKLDLGEPLPQVRADREALTSAVRNLVDNAIKYSRQDTSVLVKALAMDGRIVIRIEDRGFGIPEEDRSRIFDKFYRGRGETTKEIKGAGLGLSLVKHIVDAHGGTVDFDTAVGHGSTFRISLPALS
jgi:signal transduction histidine kinase